jgi:hypothetical protein
VPTTSFVTSLRFVCVALFGVYAEVTSIALNESVSKSMLLRLLSSMHESKMRLAIADHSWKETTGRTAGVAVGIQVEPTRLSTKTNKVSRLACSAAVEV